MLHGTTVRHLPFCKPLKPKEAIFGSNYQAESRAMMAKSRTAARIPGAAHA